MGEGDKKPAIDLSWKANARSLVGLLVLLLVIGIGYWAYTGWSEHGSPFSGSSPASGSFCMNNALKLGWELDFVRMKATIVNASGRGAEFPLEASTSGFTIKQGDGIGVRIVDTDTIEINGKSQLHRRHCAP